MRILIALIFTLSLMSTGLMADVRVGIEADQDGIKSFHLAIGEFYNIPEKDITIIVEKNIPDEELPVVFFIAEKARVNSTTIIKLRLKGLSWINICHKYGLTAEIFYFELNHDPGPPYGKAYGHFKNKKREEWKNIVLADIDIVNFVNLRFLSVHYGYSPDEVIKLRAAGHKFVNIHKDIKVKKHNPKPDKKVVHQSNEQLKQDKKKGKK